MRYSSITIIHGSLLEVEADVIVNAANTMMRGGGGIDGKIHEAAGRKLLLELQRVAPKGCERGEVVVTPGFDLPQKWIIHTPGPIWRGGGENEEEILRRCYVNSVRKAVEIRARSVGFCSISTGVYAFPLHTAAPIAIDTVAEHGSELDQITFAMFGSAEFEVFEQVLRDRLGR